MKLSLVIPCYNEVDNVRPLFDAITKTFDGKVEGYEIIFVNDGSKDGTLGELKKIFEEKKQYNVKVVSFSRNFGKEAAMYAGLGQSRGEYTAVMDADLQQPPAFVLDMVGKLDDDDTIDCVAAYQASRKEGKVLSLYKRAFYRIINKISDIEFVQGASDFRTMRRKMVDAVLGMPEYFRFSKGIFSWVGFEVFYMPYEVDERAYGKSKWSFFKLFKYALEGIVSFTTVPLRIATVMGALASVMAALYLVVVVIQKIFLSIDVPGYATIVVLILFLGGIQLLVLGIIGEYLSRMYVEGKKRPIYIAKEILTYEND